MFQHTAPEKEETRKLVHTINTALSDTPMRQDILDGVFDSMWPKLETAIANLPKSAPGVIPKRETRDMVEEILDLVRAEANARTSVSGNLYTQDAPFGYSYGDSNALSDSVRLNAGYALGRTMPLSALRGRDYAIMPPAKKDAEQTPTKKKDTNKG